MALKEWVPRLIGALVRVMELISLDSVLNVVKKRLSNKLVTEVIEKNLNAVKRGFQEVRQDIIGEIL